MAHNRYRQNRVQPEGMLDLMKITAKIRARRAEARTRRAVNRAIDMAATPAMKHELMMIAQQQSFMR
ncbi:hypothetical protein EV192_101550 [Actinocrispum wychmicini]|uniref:Uncharacterized protein n=1 Tax=Actinocrispum wychmicini TaxID=1213861 RepID=A0A4R2JZH5_9PSEU|nr:hypothetical protein EV192_101550 [Actinocrispum wychmicini]